MDQCNPQAVLGSLEVARNGHARLQISFTRCKEYSEASNSQRWPQMVPVKDEDGCQECALLAFVSRGVGFKMPWPIVCKPSMTGDQLKPRVRGCAASSLLFPLHENHLPLLAPTSKKTCGQRLFGSRPQQARTSRTTFARIHQCRGSAHLATTKPATTRRRAFLTTTSLPASMIQ